MIDKKIDPNSLYTNYEMERLEEVSVGVGKGMLAKYGKDLGVNADVSNAGKDYDAELLSIEKTV